jgi:hypothetical protein
MAFIRPDHGQWRPDEGIEANLFFTFWPLRRDEGLPDNIRSPPSETPHARADAKLFASDWACFRHVGLRLR